MMALLRANLPYIVLSLVVVGSVILRWPALSEGSRLIGLDATYHLLWTAHVFSDAPVQSHWFLPSVSLDPSSVDPIAWGAALPTDSGSLIYTSFPPLSFILAWLAVGWAPQESQFLLLGLVNISVGLACALLAGKLASRLYFHGDFAGNGERHHKWVVTSVAAVYLLTNEALISHGAVVWAHSPAQFCLLATAILFFDMVTGRCRGVPMKRLFILAFVYPSLEWTGFVANAGAAALLLYLSQVSPDKKGYYRKAAVAVITATVAAIVIMILHFGSMIGVENFVRALGERAYARSRADTFLLDLPRTYVISFALFPIFAVFVFLFLMGSRDEESRATRTLFILMFMLCLAPMMENVLLPRHAIVYTFDRLKIAVPMIVLFAYAARRYEILRRPVVLGALVFITVVPNIALYLAQQKRMSDWAEVVRRNAAMSDRFASDPAAGCILLGTSAAPRGQLGLVFDRDIVAETSLPDLVRRARQRNACGAGYLRLAQPFSEKFEVRSIEILEWTSGVPASRKLDEENAEPVRHSRLYR